MGVVDGMNRAVFLDRDGVLNRVTVDEAGVPHPPATVAELELEPGAEAACRSLKDAGWLLIVVTNQPDVARGTVTVEEVDAINARLSELLPLDEILVCFHDDLDRCACRKPQPGLLFDATQRWDIDLSSSVIVGDRASDVEAGRRAGCRTVLLDRAYSGSADPDAQFREMSQVAWWILAADRESTMEDHAPAVA